jgi:arabinose-5-phosphate isomerase
MICDRDLRLFERGDAPVQGRIADEIMNLGFRDIDGGAFAAPALVLMEERKITSLIVTGVDGLALVSPIFTTSGSLS